MSTQDQLIEALLNAATNARHWFEGNPEGALAEIEHHAEKLASYRAPAPAAGEKAHAANCATQLDRAWAGECDCGAAPAVSQAQPLQAEPVKNSRPLSEVVAEYEADPERAAYLAEARAALQAERDLTEEQACTTYFRGNSVRHIKDKATAYGDEIMRCWFVLKKYGLHPGRTDDALHEVIDGILEDQRAAPVEAVRAPLTEINDDALDTIFRAAYGARKDAKKRALTSSEVALLACEERLMRAGVSWHPEDCPTIRFSASAQAGEGEADGN